MLRYILHAHAISYPHRAAKRLVLRLVLRLDLPNPASPSFLDELSIVNILLRRCMCVDVSKDG